MNDVAHCKFKGNDLATKALFVRPVAFEKIAVSYEMWKGSYGKSKRPFS